MRIRSAHAGGGRRQPATGITTVICVFFNFLFQRIFFSHHFFSFFSNFLCPPDHFHHRHRSSRGAAGLYYCSHVFGIVFHSFSSLSSLHSVQFRIVCWRFLMSSWFYIPSHFVDFVVKAYHYAQMFAVVYYRLWRRNMYGG